KVAGVKPIISLTDEWAKFYSEKYTQAGVIVSANLVKTNPKLVKALYNELKNSKNYAITNANSLKNVLISAGSSLQIDFTVDVINECNLGIENAFAIKKDVENYLTIIGDKLPNENFYIDNEKL
ncbi:MAG: hypothetical protein J6R88_00575, partial [Clostridia bacterium]|nr:hypothetical protein [Clostridia bacterium]